MSVFDTITSGASRAYNTMAPYARTAAPYLGGLAGVLAPLAAYHMTGSRPQSSPSYPGIMEAQMPPQHGEIIQSPLGPYRKAAAWDGEYLAGGGSVRRPAYRSGLPARQAPAPMEFSNMMPARAPMPSSEPMPAMHQPPEAPMETPPNVEPPMAPAPSNEGGFLSTLGGYARKAAPYIGGGLAAMAPFAAAALGRHYMGSPVAEDDLAGYRDVGALPTHARSIPSGNEPFMGPLGLGGMRGPGAYPAPYRHADERPTMTVEYAGGGSVYARDREANEDLGQLMPPAPWDAPLPHFAGGGFLNTVGSYARKAAPYIGGGLAALTPLAAGALMASHGGGNGEKVYGDMGHGISGPGRTVYPGQEFADGGYVSDNPMQSDMSADAVNPSLAHSTGVPQAYNSSRIAPLNTLAKAQQPGMGANPYLANNSMMGQNTMAQPAQGGFPAYNHVGNGRMGAWLGGAPMARGGYAAGGMPGRFHATELEGYLPANG